MLGTILHLSEFENEENKIFDMFGIDNEQWISIGLEIWKQNNLKNLKWSRQKKENKNLKV